jgi:hypothetical protein
MLGLLGLLVAFLSSEKKLQVTITTSLANDVTLTLAPANTATLATAPVSRVTITHSEV